MNPMQSPNAGVGRKLSGNGSRFRDIELEAEMFRIIRSNGDKTAKVVMRKIKEHIPGITNKQIISFLDELKAK